MTDLHAAAADLLANGRGILAIDETPGTIGGRFEKLGIESTPETRSSYRELLITTPDLGTWIGGAILQDETFNQTTSAGTTFPEALAKQGIAPGIKVDTGAKPLAGHPNETVTEGLDGLRDRLADYKEKGAVFAKWRAVYRIDGEVGPTPGASQANAHALARYAALCQEAGIVPIVEPEVLLEGDHSIERCAEVTAATLRGVFNELAAQRVDLRGIVLKPSMVVPGKAGDSKASTEEVAKATLKVFAEVVPAAVPSVAFLSGGQSPVQATEHLQAMNAIGDFPWQLGFSYGRALQDDPLATWKGDDANREKAQEALAVRAKANAAASKGEYDASFEPS
jgi:fructose-bisphosphate aldolase class I